ncbi:MAG: hypothetical protein WCO00_14595 [Rhodospirillaceae bacterium]
MSLLAQEPDAPVATLDDLLGIAAAMESEAVGLYAGLESEMSRQGADDVAAVFRRLVAMEQSHVGAVAAIGQTLLGHAVTPFSAGDASVWHRVILPTADEAASTVLTPYRALSIAVRAEERAFAFYSYLAAGTADQALRHHAEALAAEELQHAAQLRIERRKAYHCESRRRSPPIPDSPEALTVLAGELQAETTRTIAALPGGDGVKRNLRETVRLLERLYDTYNTIAERTDSEAVMTAALSLAETVLPKLALARQRLITTRPAPQERRAPK